MLGEETKCVCVGVQRVEVGDLIIERDQRRLPFRLRRI